MEHGGLTWREDASERIKQRGSGETRERSQTTRAVRATPGMRGQVVRGRGTDRGKRATTSSELDQEQNALQRQRGESRGSTLMGGNRVKRSSEQESRARDGSDTC